MTSGLRSALSAAGGLLGVLAVLCAAGCASHRAARAAAPPPPAGEPVAAARPDATAQAGAAEPSAPPRAASGTIEAADQRLAEALLRATALPSVTTHREAAIEYRRVGIMDKAFDHFAAAVALDQGDASSHEGMARIWRDWGTPQLGLGSAYRAVHFAPGSAAAANTLGTLLQALGHLPEAETWYGRALSLEPGAWFALNNICYVRIMRRQPTALEICEKAAAASPNTATAKNNLALALAASGDMVGAKQWFRRAGTPAVAAYNYGIALMATRDYAGAAVAFADALDADPTSTLAAQRARQARLATIGKGQAQ
jgi:tetratricopeptide (TPR) repeat protein